MFDLHDQVADLGLQLEVFGFQLAFPQSGANQQCVVAILCQPLLDQALGQLVVSGGLTNADGSRFDLQDELTLELDFELSTYFSHFEYLTPPPPAPFHASKGLWKMSHRWKSANNADFHTMLGKASHKTTTLSHISHSPDDDSYW